MSGTLRSLGRLQAKSTALFICDVQERFRSHIHAFGSVITTAQKMVAAANILEIPIFATEQYSQRLGNTVPEIDISKAKLVLEKSKFSMVLPEMEEALQNHGIKSVVLLGIESHVCVLQTALDLLEREYDVHVVSDGVSSMNAPEVPVALDRMRQSGAFVATSETLLFQLTKDAKSPSFKAISSLVKEFQPAARDNKLLYRSNM
ncbi:hypothetical protein H4R34_003599 [Dimargaris verticillata]|uniref:Isochorismatase-like domain-containing protein n=1 Tax=Dimargaris verticillata TaxID=2761393 RepID=A0A9W8AZQ2_9FUNG|nr:hypothetical protein H4R34_003599 [Dimargaris verticillata]